MFDLFIFIVPVKTGISFFSYTLFFAQEFIIQNILIRDMFWDSCFRRNFLCFKKERRERKE